MDLVRSFIDLFEGNPFAYGRVHGESVKEPITDEMWAQHLWGDKGDSLGIYPLRLDVKNADDPGRWVVKWGCVDIDLGYDLHVTARNLRNVLAVLGITSWIERSKGKGFHVWVFADSWVPAATMRSALMVACQVAGVPPKEVNPKSVELGAGQLGNYLNLAFAGPWVQEGKRVVLDEFGEDMTLLDFVEKATASRTPLAKLEEVASLYTPPAPPRFVAVRDYDGELATLVSRMSGLAVTHFRNGPLEDRVTGRIDRSSGVFRMAHLLHGDGFTPTEALALLRDFDSRFGKYSERADCELQLLTIVERTYQ